MGIIIFTIIIRIIILPMMFYQTKSMMKTQELAPQLKALQKKYSSKDRETMQQLQIEQQKLYKGSGRQPVCVDAATVDTVTSHVGLVPSHLADGPIKDGDLLVAPVRTHRPLLRLTDSGSGLYLHFFLAVNGLDARKELDDHDDDLGNANHDLLYGPPVLGGHHPLLGGH